MPLSGSDSFRCPSKTRNLIKNSKRQLELPGIDPKSIQVRCNFLVLSWATELRKQSFILFYLFTTCKFLLKFTSSNFLLHADRGSREAAAQLYQFCISFQEADFLRTKHNKNKPADVKHGGREANCFYKVICRGLQQVPTCHHVSKSRLTEASSHVLKIKLK